MKKSEFAQNYYDLLNTFTNFVTTKQKQNYQMPDFSFWDKVVTEKKVNNDTEMQPQINTTIKQKTSNESSTESRAIVELASNIAKCKKCQISNLTKNKVVGRGNVQSNIMIISFFVDDECEKTNFPLTNRAYNLLKNMFKAINLNLDDLFITSLLKCNPKNSKISINCIENCLFHLDQEIKIINPKIIFALGSEANSGLCHKLVNIDQYHGQMLNYRGFPVFPTYHPQDVISNPFLRQPVWDDLRKFAVIYSNILNNPGYKFE